MADGTFTKADLEEAFAKALKGNQPATAGANSATSGALGTAFKELTAPIQTVTKHIGDNVTAFQNLSATGNSFNNDMIGMKVAAANSRMSLEEMSGVLTKSGKDFAGLGGNVAKGGQAFTEFSKTFFDSGLTENLRQMGYTSKDLNEVLASQIGFQKSTTDTSVAGQIRTAQAAADLATEMDLIAKQTGKTRKEQEAALEKAKADGQIEAKMRLIGLTQGAEAEKVAREGFAKQLAQAEAMGTGQVFKEMFATGTVRSQEAAMQMGLLGEAARGTAESAKQLSKGNIEASQASMESAKVGNLANQKNVALLNITASGVGPAADVMKKNIESNDAMYHGTKKLADATGNMLKSSADMNKALSDSRKSIQDEQQARHGATAATISAMNRLQDANAAVMNKLVTPLNTGELNKKGLEISKQLSSGVGTGDTAKTTADQYAKMLVAQSKVGGASVAPASSREKIEKGISDFGGDKLAKMLDIGTASGVEGAMKGAQKVGNFVSDVITVRDMNVNNAKMNMPTRDEGTLGKTGQPFEPQDFIGKIAKGEMVLTPDQAMKFMQGAKTEGLVNAVQDMAKSMPKMNADMGSFDLGSIAKEISTTVSASPGASSINPAEKAQSLIDEAIKAKEKALSELNKMLNEGSDEELNAAYERFEKANEQLTKIVDDSMGDLVTAFDDAGETFETSLTDVTKDVVKAPEIKEKPKFQMPNMGQLTIGPDGMPKISAKAQAETIPAATKPADKKSDTTKPASTTQTGATQTDGKEDKPGATTTKESSQDDVAKLLSSLNTTMNKVYNSIEGMSGKLTQQVKATKAMSGNAHDRT